MHDPFANPTLTTAPSRMMVYSFGIHGILITFLRHLTPNGHQFSSCFILFHQFSKVTMLQIYGTSLSLEAIEVLFESQLGSLGFGARYHGAAADGVWRLKDLGTQLTDAVEAVAEGMELRLGWEKIWKNDRLRFISWENAEFWSDWSTDVACKMIKRRSEGNHPKQFFDNMICTTVLSCSLICHTCFEWRHNGHESYTWYIRIYIYTKKVKHPLFKQSRVIPLQRVCGVLLSLLL